MQSSRQISDDRQPERAYLTMEARYPAFENLDLQKGCCVFPPRSASTCRTAIG
jgi:hypothetical protein